MHKENINLPKIVGLLRYLQHVHNYEIKIVNENIVDIVEIATLTRESRNKKRS